MTELKRDELRKKLEKLVQYAERLGFNVVLVDVDIGVERYYVLGEAVPKIEGLMWEISLKLESSTEEVNSCQSKCSECKFQSR